MILAELVGDLPVVIAKAVMRFIQDAEDHNKDFLTIQGDLNVTLPDLNILIGLNQTLTQEQCALNTANVSSQTEVPAEAIVKDGGSTDITVKVLHKDSGSSAKYVDVAVQTIKTEKDDSETPEINMGNDESGDARPIGVIRSIEPEEDSEEDVESDLDDIPFVASPETPTKQEENMDIDDRVLMITPRRTRSMGGGDSSNPGSVERPRRRIKHTPKLQDLLARRKEIQAKRRTVKEPEKTKASESSPKGKKAANNKTNVTKKTATISADENEENMFSCSLCNKTFSRKSNLNDHMFTHNKEANYQCPKCDKYFLRLSKLKGHHERAHGEPIDPDTLGFLQRAMSGLKAIAALEEQGGPMDSVFSCDLCGRCFNRKSSLKDHMFTHNQESSYQCPKCMKFFLRLSKLRLHYEKVHEGVLDIDSLPTPKKNVPEAQPIPPDSEKRGDHECPVCLRTFKRHSSMKEHMFVHDRQHGFKCQSCGLTCVSEARLNRHIKRKHGRDALVAEKDRPYKCSECPQSFVNEQALNDHTAGHEVPKEFKCGRCEEVFPDLSVLQKHQLTVHLNKPSTIKEREFQCGICQKHFANSSALRFHLKTHGDLLRCDDCDKTFVREEELMAHYEKTHSLKRGRRDEWLTNVEVRCHVCMEDFDSYYDLLQHQNMHLNLGVDFVNIEGCAVERLGHDNENVDAKNITFLCKICDNFKGLRDAAEIHMDANHAGDLILPCEYCDMKFWQESSLRTHLIFSHSAQRIYECRVCTRKFKKPSDMSDHRKAEHKDISQAELRGRVQCKHCSKSFNTPSRLNDHIWVVHDKKPKPLKCPHCPKSFMRNYYLKEHVQTHTGTMKYMCEVCGKGFRRPYELEQHRHEGELFKCHICEATFTTLNGYKLHVRRHTETPPLMCNYCGKTFFFKVHLTNHERSHTGEKPFQCSICNKFFRTKNLMNEHKKIHGDAKHYCSQCYRTFPLKRQLTAHIQSQHERNLFYCAQCSKSFTRRQSFKAHVLRHNLLNQNKHNQEDVAEEYEETYEVAEDQGQEREEEEETNQALVYLVVDENTAVIQEDGVVVSQAKQVFVPAP